VLGDATLALATMAGLLVHRAGVVSLEGDNYPARASRLRPRSAARARLVGQGITKTVAHESQGASQQQRSALECGQVYERREPFGR
jgi:hypothetical protein